MGCYCVLLLGVLCHLVVFTANEKVSFRHYEVHRLVPRSKRQVRALRSLQENPNGLSFWTSVNRKNAPVDILVPPTLRESFLKKLDSIHLKSRVNIKDVQQLIDKERPRVRSRFTFNWRSYYPLSNIYLWLENLAEQYPNVVTLVVGGETYEGRQIRGVKVSHREGNPAVFIEGGTHAREWVAPAAVTYILNKLVKSKDPSIKDIALSFDFHIFPVLNPDGYEYTHTTDRMWRKTRSRSNGSCFGVDPNRNWDFHWGDKRDGASDPCSESYAGSKPFSEIEVKSISEYIAGIAKKLQVYLTFHAYQQLLMFPYAFTSRRVSNYDDLMRVGKKAIDALAMNNGTKYQVGDVYHTIYPARGSSVDWVRGTLQTPIVFTWELRDTGEYGFILPAKQIKDTAEETLLSVIAILQEVKTMGNNTVGARTGRRLHR